MLKYSSALFLFFLLSLFSENAFSNEKKVVVGADVWCPYNCIPGTEKPGYMIEILRKALEPHGYTVVYKITSWEYALKSVADGTLSAIVGSSYVEERPVTYTRYPLGETYNVYVTRTDFQTPESKIDFTTVKVGALVDYEYGKSQLGEYINDNPRAENIAYISSNKGVLHNLEKLISRDIDITLADKKVILELFEKYPLLAASLRLVHPHNTDKNKIKLYVGFSKVLGESETLARYVDAYLLKSKYSGELDHILRKYNLSEDDYRFFKGIK